MLCFLQVLVAILAVAMLAIIANFVVVIPTVVLFVVALILRWYVLRSALPLQRLEAIGQFIYGD